MSSIRVRPEQFSKAVEKALAEYEDHALDVIQSSATNVARQTASELKASGPSGGPYARGWTHKKQGGRATFAETVYNRVYQLTHLLEKPHITWNGGKYPSKKDHTGILERIEEEQTNKFYEEVVDSL